MMEGLEMSKRYLILVLAALLLFSVYGAPLNSSEIGVNSVTYLQNFYDAVNAASSEEFNTTVIFADGGVTYLTVPEYSSSTVQNASTLTTTYTGGTSNYTLYEIRSDMFSEVGIVLAMHNDTLAFYNWFNTLQEFDVCGYGTLPCWVMIRNSSTFQNPSGGNDTAIDGDVRVATALLIASQNPLTSSGNSTTYLNYATQMFADIYAYDTISIASTATDHGAINRLAMGGGDCAAAGIGCSTDMWSGYMGDIAGGFYLAGNMTGNTTYTKFADNVTAAYLTLALQEGNTSGFGVMPFNINYAGVGTSLTHTDGGGVNAYHYDSANPQWDDSDAPRAYSWGWVAYLVEKLGYSNAVTTALDAYVTAWIASPGITNDDSALQYFYNGTPATAVTTGYYNNGLGALLFLSQNTSDFETKLDETLGHYSWTTNTFDSTSGGNGLTYRGIRPLKALGFAMDLDFTVSAQSEPEEPEPPESQLNDVCTNIMGMYRSVGTNLIIIGIIAAVLMIFGALGGIVYANTSQSVDSSMINKGIMLFVGGVALFGVLLALCIAIVSSIC